ncbi:hypothetical protein [Psychroflexus tropicus]|uniref:hypothetical protein n=1 Tax=Psychroflexus tropicus TaxID=197345 RepID=UPI00039E2C07|nr:hypothetical protein [Psychroflexus tropicus]
MHLILIVLVIVSSLGYAYGLNWDAIRSGNISFKELGGFFTSVFVLFVLVLGYYYKPKDTE